MPCGWASGAEGAVSRSRGGRGPRRRPADRGRDRASPRELGRRAGRRRRGRGTTRRVPPGRPLRRPAAPQSTGSRAARRAAPADSTTSCSPSRWGTRASPACSRRCHLVITDSGRHPGGGSLARQAGPGRPRIDRENRGHRGRNVVDGGHESRPDRGRGRSACSMTRRPTRHMAERPQSLRRRARRRSGSWRRSSSSAWAASRPEQFGSGYERRAVLLAAGYQGALDPDRVPADARGDAHDELGSRGRPGSGRAVAGAEPPLRGPAGTSGPSCSRSPSW